MPGSSRRAFLVREMRWQSAGSYRRLEGARRGLRVRAREVMCSMRSRRRNRNLRSELGIVRPRLTVLWRISSGTSYRLRPSELSERTGRYRAVCGAVSCALRHVHLNGRVPFFARCMRSFTEWHGFVFVGLKSESGNSWTRTSRGLGGGEAASLMCCDAACLLTVLSLRMSLFTP